MANEPQKNFLGGYLARQIEDKLPPLDKTIGEIILALSKSKDNTWKTQARELRDALATLGFAITRLEKEQLEPSYYTALWRALEPLAQFGRAPVKKPAKRAQKEYEQIWREVIKLDASLPKTKKTIKETIREKNRLAILCKNCKKPAIEYVLSREYTEIKLPKDEYEFVKSYVNMGMAHVLASYLQKYLRFGLEEYCPSCDAFYCTTCQPEEHQRIPYSEREPIMVTCPNKHERQVNEL